MRGDEMAMDFNLPTCYNLPRARVNFGAEGGI
jgi:hypothetical protein